MESMDFDRQPDHTELQTRYFGFPEVRQQAIESAVELLRFRFARKKPVAVVFFGPQKVGKTSAVLEIERKLVASGLPCTRMHNPEALDSSVPGIRIFNELPIERVTIIKDIAARVEGGEQVVLDILNKRHPQADPRNVDEVKDVLANLFPSNLLVLYPLYSVQTSDAIPAIIQRGLGIETADLVANEKIKKALAEHQRAVTAAVRGDYFVAGQTTFEPGLLRTELVWTGKEMSGSPFGQSVTTVF